MKNVRSTFICVLTGMLAVAAPAFADPISNAAEDHETIVVIGEKERQKKITAFIRSTVKKTNDDQYARFNEPVCPVTMGLPNQYEQFIVQRIRDVAAAAGAPVADADCTGNMAVIIINDPRDWLTELRSEYSGAFSGLSIKQRNRITEGPGPAHAWNVVRTENTRNPGAPGVGGASAGGIDDGGGGDETIDAVGGSGSRLYVGTQQDIEMSILVIEKKALIGTDLRQIADYAVMRLMANTDEPATENASERSILSLFSGRVSGFDAPQSVTAWDLALLTALYKAPDNLGAISQRRYMTKIFEKELVRIASAEDDGS